jgi:hypothetical protein
MKFEDINLEEFKCLLKVVNECIFGITQAVNPKDYKNNPDYFINVILTAIAMITASIINKVRGTFDLDTYEIEEAFIKKLKLTLLWEMHKDRIKESEND